MHKTHVNTESTKIERSDGNEPLKTQFIGAYTIGNMAQVSIIRGTALDYANMRASQLDALLHATYGDDGFDRFSDEIKNDILWLASRLADELKNLLPIVNDDAAPMKRGGAQ